MCAHVEFNPVRYCAIGVMRFLSRDQEVHAPPPADTFMARDLSTCPVPNLVLSLEWQRCTNILSHCTRVRDFRYLMYLSDTATHEVYIIIRTNVALI